ncbi:hypothetical protein AFCDBAGC_3663 [Methylobacterium cerastii]|uniref:3',5'-cyclic-nucleotide phosphodiesterase n=1 Tax=Methylobacterium cerastii TaxID=932741 RepID=A0ABQ4QM08_9HYPH|nr:MULTISPECIES: hypothetical protein [Methylobacterium]TXN07926.1 hypothetical protein FV219_07835 [Methylobacterium sp. WL122]TXM65987.1 hypothetical protein FV229_14020 [Methylobacterium sp. WL120]TXM74612.1 hypothetical protein FV226_05875 [Methylobacterium sp. WL12]TXN03862.1 hypothetical protein FV222_08125 [Methylobacterium sp. WL103]GJD45786.1 hypothetical protein AFCDBAGC_3663 [Methylobacterium cerastii]
MPRLRTALLAAGLFALPGAGLAQTNPLREVLKLNCTGDYLEHCSEHPPGGPAVEACFRANLKKLSPDCASAITRYKRETKVRH